MIGDIVLPDNLIIWGIKSINQIIKYAVILINDGSNRISGEKTTVNTVPQIAYFDNSVTLPLSRYLLRIINPNRYNPVKNSNIINGLD